jgi:AraC-like DNA-binding protein
MSERRTTAVTRALAAAPVTRVRSLVVRVVPAVGAWYKHEEMVIVYHEGSDGLAALVDGREQFFEAGSIVVYPAGVTHCSSSHTPGLHHCLLLRGVPAAANLWAYLPPAAAARCVPAFLDAIHDRAAGGAPLAGLAALAARLRATALLAELLAAATAGYAPPGLAAGYAQEARRYIEAHCDTIRHLAEVATAVGLSYDHLRRLYREHSGETLKATLDRCRLDRARHLLTTTNLPLKAIAAACGYASDRHLCTRFHTATGHRPTAWRRAVG